MNAARLFALLTRLGIQKLRERNGNIVGCCPIHDERRPSWGISVKPPHVYGCFSCGAGGTLVYLLTNHYRVGILKANEIVGVSTLSELTEEFPRTLELGHKPKQGDRASFDLHLMEPAGLAYLARRHFTWREVVDADLRYLRGEKRILFPWQIGATFYGATSRTIRAVPDVTKGQAFFGLHKREALYMPRGKWADSSTLVLVEGELDALRIATCCKANVAALGHARFSAGQASLALNSAPANVVLFFDNDEAGRTITELYATHFAGRVGMRVWTFDYSVFPHFKDPADFPPKIMRRVLSAKTEYLTSRTTKSLAGLRLT